MPEETTQPTQETNQDSTSEKEAGQQQGTEQQSQTPGTTEGEDEGQSLLSGGKKGEAAAEEQEETPSGEANGEALTFESLNLPEGFDVNQEGAKDFLAALNDENLSRQDLGRKMVELYAAEVSRFEQEANREWLDMNNKWQEDLERQHGAVNLEQKMSQVGALFNRYDKDMKDAVPQGQNVPEFGKDLREALNLTGAGNNPAIVNFCIWLADQLGEGSPLSGSPASQERSLADRMFGT